MATWFTSDTHFGDHRVLNLYPRPFGTTAEMDAELTRWWNQTVSPEDEVWHLGDFARTAARAAAVLSALNGRKHLVLGNNDLVPGPGLWASVSRYAELEVEGRFLVLCHYPFRSWNRQHRGAVNLHGHSHGRLKPVKNQFDVGVDANGYRPVSLEMLLPDRA